MGCDSWPGWQGCVEAAGRRLLHGQAYLCLKCSITNNDAGR